MLSLGVFRPWWAMSRDTRPSGGWHRVEASRRWHLYQVDGLMSWQGDGMRVHRACDDAEAAVPRRPRLVHGDALDLRPGDAVCATCWRAWEAILALPTPGSFPFASYAVEPDPAQRREPPPEAPRRDQHMGQGRPSPGLTCGGGWT